MAAPQNGFAVVVDPKHEKVLGEIMASASGIERLVEPLGPWLSEQSIAALSLERGNLRMFEELERLVEKDEPAAGGDRNRLASDPTPAMLEGLKQLKGEITRCGLGIELADRGPILSIKAAFKPGGQIAQQVEKTTWPAAPNLNALPAGDFVFADAGILPRVDDCLGPCQTDAAPADGWLKRRIARATRSDAGRPIRAD